METYNYNDFKEAGIDCEFVQDNQSASKKGVLRGLHFQINYPQDKLVRVVNGEVFDVAVDLREGSETFGKWFGVTLSAENKKHLGELIQSPVFTATAISIIFLVISHNHSLLVGGCSFLLPWSKLGDTASEVEAVVVGSHLQITLGIDASLCLYPVCLCCVELHETNPGVGIVVAILLAAVGRE